MLGKEAMDILIDRYGYHEGTAKAYVESMGICTYCQEDLMEFRQGYSSATIDHLLPVSKYSELEMNYNNWVFCCSSCNSMKHNMDVLGIGESAIDMINNNRSELIERVKERMKQKIIDRELEYKEIRLLIQNY